MTSVRPFKDSLLEDLKDMDYAVILEETLKVVFNKRCTYQIVATLK